METGTKVRTLWKIFKFLSMITAFLVDSQAVWEVFFLSEFIYSSVQVIHLCPSPLWFLYFSSTIVHPLLSAAWLSYPDLLYRSKDTEAAAALVLEEIMELESTWAMSERRKWSKAEKRSNLSTKWFRAAIQSMGNSAAVSYFSSAPGPRANVLHYRRVRREKVRQTMK